MAMMELMALLAKIETTYATDIVPTAAANALLMSNVDWTPLEGEEVRRTRVLPYFGNDQVMSISPRSRLRGGIDFVSSGAAVDLPPAWSPLLRGCGLAQVITTGVSVAFNPVSAGFESASLYHFVDGTRQRGLGARGDWGFELRAKAIPRLTVDMMALYDAPTGVALPIPVLTSWPDPQPLQNGITTISVTPGPLSNLRLSAFTYANGATLAFRELTNFRGVIISGRRPTATLVVEAPDGVATNLFALVGSIITVTATHQHGAAPAGTTVEAMVRARVLPNIRYSNEEGVVMATMNLSPEPSAAGNDEVRLTTR